MSRGLRALGSDPEGGEGAWPAPRDGAKGLPHLAPALAGGSCGFSAEPRAEAKRRV